MAGLVESAPPPKTQTGGDKPAQRESREQVQIWGTEDPWGAEKGARAGRVGGVKEDCKLRETTAHGSDPVERRQN